MKREVVFTYLFLILLIGSFLLLFYFFDIRLTGLGIYEQLSQSDFDEGVYDNTEYNGSGIVLVEGNSGTYTSKIFDGGSNVRWNNISWGEVLPTASKTLTISPVYAEDSWGQDISSKVNADDDTDTWERVEVQTWNDTMSEGEINSVVGSCNLKWIDTEAEIGFQVSRDGGTSWDSEICLQDVVAHTTFDCDLKTNSGVDSVEEINNLRMRCTFPTADSSKYYSTDFVYVVIDYTFSPTDLSLQARSCDDENCDGEDWNNISGNSTQELSLDNNRYFQYKFNFETDDASYTTELQNVGIDYSVLNSPPTWEIIPNQTWDEDTTLTINLTNYSSDSDGDNLEWSFEEVTNISITINGSIATLTPASNWFGTTSVIFTATDGIESVDSNNITLIVEDIAEPVVAPSAPAPSSSGGGGGGGSSPRQYTATTKEISEGVTKELKKDDKINFEIENIGGKEKHSISLGSVSDEEVTIVIQSEPIITTIKINESKKFDLDQDGFYDLYVELEEIVFERAKIKMQTIHEEIPVEEPGQVIETGEEIEEVAPVTGGVSRVTGAVVGFLKAGGWVVLVFVAVIVFILTHLKTRKKSKKSKRKRIKKRKR